MNLQDEIKKSRTFAIISHPDAGKTTITEQLLYLDRKSTRLNSSNANISYAVLCLKKKHHSLFHLASYLHLAPTLSAFRVIVRTLATCIAFHPPVRYILAYVSFLCLCHHSEILFSH